MNGTDAWISGALGNQWARWRVELPTSWISSTAILKYSQRSPVSMSLEGPSLWEHLLLVLQEEMAPLPSPGPQHFSSSRKPPILF